MISDDEEQRTINTEAIIRLCHEEADWIIRYGRWIIRYGRSIPPRLCDAELLGMIARAERIFAATDGEAKQGVCPKCGGTGIVIQT